MLALGEADAMITGTTRPFSQSLKQVRLVIDDEPDATPFGDHRRRRPQPHRADRRHRGDRAADGGAICRDRDALVGIRAADGARAARRLHQLHDLRQPARRAHRGAARRGRPARPASRRDFEFEGEMAPDVALNYEMQKRYYPFTPAVGPANILVMPGPAVGEHLGQAAPRARRRKRAWARTCSASSIRCRSRR